MRKKFCQLSEVVGEVLKVQELTILKGNPVLAGKAQPKKEMYETCRDNTRANGD